MRKKDWVFLGVIVVAAILFRLILMTKAYSIGFDEVNYLKLAASGKINGLNHVLHTYWSPFYPLVVALFSYIVPNFEIAGRLISILCASLVIIPLFLFINKNFNKKVAYGTVLLTAFYSFAAYFSIKAEADFIYSLVALTGIILGWQALKYGHSLKAIPAGILFAFAYLSRPEGLGFLLVFGGIVALVLVYRLFQRQKIRSLINILLLSGFSFAVVAAPYLLFLKQSTGTWTISTKGTVNQQGAMYVRNKDKFQENPFHTLSPDNTRLMMDEIYHLGSFVSSANPEKKTVVKVSITGLAKKVFENIYKLITEAVTQVLPFPLIMLLALGLFKTPWTRERMLINLYLLSFLIFFWFGVIPVFHITLRYFVPLLPLSFIFIANGAIEFSEWLNLSVAKIRANVAERLPFRVIGLALIAVVVVVSSILPEFGRRMGKSKYSTAEWAPCIEQKKAGLWLKEHGVPHPIIMAYNHAVSFYAGNYDIKESVEIPENKIDRVLEYAKFRGVNYIVLNDRYKHNYPLIAHLLDQKDIPPGLKLIYSDVEKNGLRTVIYEVVN